MNLEELTLDEIAHVQGWLRRYVKPQDREVIDRLCSTAVYGALAKTFVPDLRRTESRAKR